MKIGIAQINTSAGNLDYNLQKIGQSIQTLGKENDVVVFPEMAISGAPLYDQNNQESFVLRQQEILQKIQDIALKTSENLKVIIGYIDIQGGEENQYSNAAAVIGKDIQIYHKQNLPNKGIKNEPRYFAPGTENLLFTFWENLKGALTIWEDITNPNILQSLQQEKADAVFNISSTFFEWESASDKLQKTRDIQKKLDSTYVQVNQVGGEGGIIFDGMSTIIDKNGNLLNESQRFQESLQSVDTENETSDFSSSLDQREEYQEVLETMKLALKDYLEKRNISDVVIWVSGGLDSAVDLYVASQVLPPERIHAIYMPTKFNANESLQLSQTLTNNLGIELKIWEIQSLLEGYERFSDKVFEKSLQGVSHENIQARIRGNILMNLANDKKALVINNSNKTELALGYGTLYGDLIGGLALLGDLNKKRVYELSNYINKDQELIPQGIIQRKASAELSDGQVDPFDYERISEPVDELLFGAEVNKVSEKYGIPLDELQQLQNRIERARFKGEQIPAVVKLTKNTINQGTKFPY